MADAEQDRRIAEIIAKLAELAVYTDDDLAEARERMRRVEDDPDGVFRRIDDQRIAGSSGP